MTPLVVVDLDSTLVDLHTPWLAAYHEMHPDDPVGIRDIQLYEMEQCVKYPDDIYKPLHRTGLYAALKPYDFAIEFVRSLVFHHYEVVIATDVMGSPEIAADKMRWVDRWLPFVRARNVVTGRFKHRIQADAYIDDSPHVAEKVRALWGKRPFVAGIQFPFNARSAQHFDVLAPSWEAPGVALQIIHAKLIDRF
jgi:5'(3')-deoxyribonucleotidase